MATSTPAGSPWRHVGERDAAVAQGTGAIVIAARDPNVAAEVALGIASALGATRRVAIADLVGEVPPLQALVTGDDPHGIVDSFLYGVSLNRIARPLPGAGTVFLLPSGTEAVATSEVYGNERWRRLAAGFQQVGALLLVVAVPGVPGFDALCAFVGAVLPVGTVALPPLGPDVLRLGPLSRDTPSRGIGAVPAGASVPTIDTPDRAARADDGAEGSAGMGAGPGAGDVAAEAAIDATVARAKAAAGDTPDRRRWRVVVVLLLLGALATAVGAFWPAIRNWLPAPIAALVSGGGQRQSAADAFAPDTAGLLAADQVQVLGRDSGAGSPEADAAGAPPVPEVVNPGDSLAAARFAIYLERANAPGAALSDPRARTLPAVAVSPVPEDGVTWYRVTVGASVARAEADSLLARLRREGFVGASAGSVLAVPYALRLELGVPATEVAARIRSWTGRGITAYGLRQGDGSATLYTGAFETPRQAALLADSLRSAGVTPELAHRTGRVF
jgi:hypothetical protein